MVTYIQETKADEEGITTTKEQFPEVFLEEVKMALTGKKRKKETGITA